VCVGGVTVGITWRREVSCRLLECLSTRCNTHTHTHTHIHTHTHTDEVPLFQSIIALVYYSRKKSHQFNSPILFKLLWCSSQLKTVGNHIPTVGSILAETQTQTHIHIHKSHSFLIYRKTLRVIEPYLGLWECVCVSVFCHSSTLIGLHVEAVMSD